MKIVFNDGTTHYGLNREDYEFLGRNWEQEVLWALERANPGSSDKLVPMGMFGVHDRTNPDLIRLVEARGEAAGVPGNYLKIVEIPDDATWNIYIDIETGVETLNFSYIPVNR